MVFSLSVLWWRRIRGLWKLPDGRDWLRGKLGLVLMGGAMLSKSLTQFSVDGWSCVPSLLFIWGQAMVEVMKIMVTSFKVSHACIATLSAPNPAAGHHPPTPPLETPGHSQASLIFNIISWVSHWWCFHDTYFNVIIPSVHFLPSQQPGSLFSFSRISHLSREVKKRAWSSKENFD